MVAVALGLLALGLALFAAGSMRTAAKFPGRRIPIRWTQRQADSGGVPMAFIFGGAFASALGGSELVRRFGWWVYPLCVVVMATAAWVPLMVHNRAVPRADRNQ